MNNNEHNKKDAVGYQQYSKTAVVNEKFANINFEEGINDSFVDWNGQQHFNANKMNDVDNNNNKN